MVGIATLKVAIFGFDLASPPKIAILSLLEGFFGPKVLSKLKIFVPGGTYLVFLQKLA